MINSSSSGSLKRDKSFASLNITANTVSANGFIPEKSCSTGSKASSDVSNDIAALLEFNDNDSDQINPSSSTLDNIKFEDIFTEPQSPDYSVWDSLFSDQVDFSSDFMVYSPKRNPASSGKMPSPKRNQTSTYTNLIHVGSPRSPSQITAFSSLQKGKAQSPLHKVFNSPKNRFMQPDSFTLPGVEGLMDDYQRECLGSYNSAKKSAGFACPADNFEMTLLEMLDLPTSNSSSSTSKYTDAMNEALDLPMPKITTFGDILKQEMDLPAPVTTPGSGSQSQMNPGRNLYRQRSALTAPVPQPRQQPTELLQNGGLTYDLVTPRSAVADQADFTMEQDSGLQLVHLLLACAEAVAKEEYISARRYLHHLNAIVSPLGDSMQRVASCFTDALGARLAAALTTTSNSSKPRPFTPFIANSLETLTIYQILYQTCPYIKFAHFTANQTIFEALENEERVHIIDLDILQGYQWPAFMQALAGRRNGPPFLRITGVGYPQEAVRETGRGLTELAHSLHIRFAFHPVGERLENLKPHMLHRRIGEALAVNSVNCLHRVPGASLGNLLAMIRDQAPNIVTLVEQESSHNGPYFLGRFLEALHYYSAIFDSLDATFPVDSAERAKVEQYIFALEIRNIVACEGAERVERHERLEKWRKIMEGKGFQGVSLSGHAVSQSKMLLGLYSCDGYRLREDRGCLLLGWQDRALMAASAWRC